MEGKYNNGPQKVQSLTPKKWRFIELALGISHYMYPTTDSKRSKKPLQRQLKRLFRPSAASRSSSPRQSAEVHFPAQAHPIPYLLRDAPANDRTERQHAALSNSQELWNAAYDSLKEDEETAKLIASYERILKTVSGDDADSSAELEDPTKRQAFMKKLVEEGRAKVSIPSKFTKGVGDVAQFILLAKASIDTAIQNIPQATLPWAGVCIGLQILLNLAKLTKSNLTGIAHVVSRMNWYCALTEHLLNKYCVNESFEMILPQLKMQTLALYKALLLYQMKSVCSYYRHQGLVFLRGLVDWDDWDDDLKAIKDAEAALQMDSDQYSKLQAKSALMRLVEQADNMEKSLGDIHQTLREFVSLQRDLQLDDIDRQCRWDLRVVDPKDDVRKIENKKDILLSGAYEWVLDTEQYARLTQWNDGPDPHSCRLLWVKGHAGTGKTMLLIGIIRSIEKRQDFGAPGISYFFCQGTDATLNNATAALRSLVWMLLVEQPHLISHLRKRYEESGPALFRDPNAFFALSQVFLSMLNDPKMSPILFVVDALDECDRAKPGLDELIHLILDSISCSDKVKWLLSSRPEISVLARVKNSTGETRAISDIMVELDAQCLERPVDAYINHKLTMLSGRRGYDESILAKISNEIRQRAMNTFLWVSLVFQDLNRCHGHYAFNRVKEMPSDLSDLYDHMMTRIEKVEELEPQDCKKILVCATLAFRPISLELAALSDSPSREFTETAIELCGSFLAVKDDIVYLIHQSAKEYLDKNFRNHLQPSGMAQGHVDIGMQLIKAMSAVLKQNMYGLNYDTELNDMITPQPDPLASIRYSCIFWADHFVVGVSESFEGKRALTDDGEVVTFLRDRLLHWLECLSLLGKFSEGVQSIRKLLHIAQNSNVNSQLAQFLEDANKFIQSHGSIMGRAPLQIYASALVFTPTTSEIRATQWHHRLPFIQKVAGIKSHWDVYLQTLDGQEGSIISVAFSPDGKMLASASEDRTIWLWDMASGSHQQTFEGHSDNVNFVAFAPDGKTLASASGDKTIRLWDVATGSCQQTFKGHRNSIESVVFSPSGKTLASADRKTIQLWDIATGSHQQTIEGYSETIQFIDFLSDGKTLALASWNEARLLDIVTGNCRILEQNIRNIVSMALSPNSQSLALGVIHRSDRFIWLWDLSKGSRQLLLTESSDQPNSLAFSPNGETLAAAGDVSIQLWNTATGSLEKTLESYWGSFACIAFSSDNKTLALTPHEVNEIQLWDITRNHQQTHERHDEQVESIAFSPDGKILASTSQDHTIQLWDITGSRQQTLKVHHTEVISITFSPDGKILASGTSTGDVWLWDIATGNHLQSLKGQGSQVTSIAFSPDGRMLASPLNRGKIQLWDIMNKHRRTFKTESMLVLCVAFSPDSKTLASASFKGLVELWDIATGSHKQISKDFVSHMAFSPNGKMLALAASDGSIKLWDIATQSYQQVFKGDGKLTGSITFSPDSRYLATEYDLLELDPTLISSKQYPDQSPPHHISAAEGGEWVILDGKKSLWIPAEYRATAAAVNGNTIVLGHYSGDVTFIDVVFE